MPRVARIILAVFLLVATASVIWTALLLPPPLWLLKYGLAPGCEPEGVETVAEIEFIVIGPGIARIGSSWFADQGTKDFSDGDLLGRIVRPVGMEWGEAAVPSNEMPVHWVEFPKGFALAMTEITNAQFEAYDSDHERSDLSAGDSDPVVSVTWEDAMGYCGWLSQKSGREIRLPSESEWEAACRAGSRTEYCFGDDNERLGEFAWFVENSEGRGHAVGTREPNGWGFHDLHGNVWEWCEDRWHPAYRYRWRRTTSWAPGPEGTTYAEGVELAPTIGTAWIAEGSPERRVYRGGSWPFGTVSCRSSYRFRNGQGQRWDRLGFRPALVR